MRPLAKRFLQFASDFLRKEDGPTAVEYAVMLALIIIVCFVAIQTIGTTTAANYNAIPLGSAMQSS
jgi:pilus assembly protein Flp/PilA